MNHGKHNPMGSKHSGFLKRTAVLLLICVLLSAACVVTSCGGNPQKEPNDGTRDSASVTPSGGQVQATTQGTRIEVPVQSNLPAPSNPVVIVGGKESETTAADPSATEDPSGNPASSWTYFAHNGVVISRRDDNAALVEQLGDPKSTYEAPSCLFSGNDYVYSYDDDGFEINAAMIDGKKTCVGVFPTGDSAKTPEGIGIGSSFSDVRKAYGDWDHEEIGQYVWVGDGAKLVIVVIEDVVTSVSYLMMPED